MDIGRHLDKLLYVAAGIAFGAGIDDAVEAISSSPVNIPIVIETKNQPRVMRVCRELARDRIYVQENDRSGKYISLGEYLKTNYSNELERNERQAQLERIAFSAECPK